MTIFDSIKYPLPISVRTGTIDYKEFHSLPEQIRIKFNQEMSSRGFINYGSKGPECSINILKRIILDWEDDDI